MAILLFRVCSVFQPPSLLTELNIATHVPSDSDRVDLMGFSCRPVKLFSIPLGPCLMLRLKVVSLLPGLHFFRLHGAQQRRPKGSLLRPAVVALCYLSQIESP